MQLTQTACCLRDGCAGDVDLDSQRRRRRGFAALPAGVGNLGAVGLRPQETEPHRYRTPISALPLQ